MKKTFRIFKSLFLKNQLNYILISKKERLLEKKTLSINLYKKASIINKNSIFQH